MTGESGDTVECFNCGHQNPSWAQVCRSCGYPIQPMTVGSTGPRGLFPSDQDSLVSIGLALGSILAAIVLGLVLSGLIPPAPNVALETPIPTPSPSASASASGAPSAVESAVGSVVAGPTLPGTVSFGTGLDPDTRQVTGETAAYTAGTGTFAHSISLGEPFAVAEVFEEVVRIEADGTETLVQARADGGVDVTATLQVAGFQVPVANLSGWGTGTFTMRIYRGEELLAEGSFTIS
jgi:hypothetical protein